MTFERHMSSCHGAPETGARRGRGRDVRVYGEIPQAEDASIISKFGNVGAFKAIASVLGEMMPETAVAVNAPPIVIAPHDPAWIEQERKRQLAADATIIPI